MGARVPLKPYQKRTFHKIPHAIIVGVLILLVIIVVSFLAFAVLTATSDSNMAGKTTTPPGIQTATLKIECGNCGKPCTSTTSGCPKCQDKLEGGVLKLAGVQSAIFTAGYENGSATIRYDASLVSLTTIESTIEQTPPYPQCCTGITLL